MDLKEVLLEELESNVSKDIFEKFKSPEALHFLAEHWSWESEEDIQVFWWICNSVHCSKATALLIYWRAQPEDYVHYKLGTKIQSHNNQIFAMIQYIMQRYAANDYKSFDLHYDPHEDLPMMEEIAINKFFLKATNGEESWYDKAYIKSLYGCVPDEIESEINNCNDADYLHMFAEGLKEFQHAEIVAEQVMIHPLCDRGTALLLYWRLLIYYFERGFSPFEAHKKLVLVSNLRQLFVETKIH